MRWTRYIFFQIYTRVSKPFLSLTKRLDIRSPYLLFKTLSTRNNVVVARTGQTYSLSFKSLFSLREKARRIRCKYFFDRFKNALDLVRARTHITACLILLRTFKTAIDTRPKKLIYLVPLNFWTSIWIQIKSRSSTLFCYFLCELVNL